MAHPHIDTDLLITGGGLTGLALARALRALPLSITLIDQALSNSPPAPGAASAPHFDDRVLALSESSCRLLARLGLWPELAPEASPIVRIHVSDRGHFGRCELDAGEQGLAAFGQVIELRRLGQVLWRSLQGQDNLRLIPGAQVSACEEQEDAVQVRWQGVEKGTEGEQSLRARLLLAADGGMQERPEAAFRQHDYQQSALIANIESRRPHAGRAFERFTAAGPLALLPLTRNRLSLVWTADPDEAARLATLAEPEFLSELQQAFGWRLGKLHRVGARSVFPLRRRQALQRRQGRQLLMGNAAHTLHPIAGQGFNLALRDLMQFADHLSQALASGQLLGPALLEGFVQQRAPDARQTLTATHSLVQLFSNEAPLLSGLRSLGLSALDALPLAKRHVALRAMGFQPSTGV